MNDIYSFYQLITKYKIEIPVIQRDYAQGRDNQRAASIRKSIIKNIIEAVTIDKKLFFDFVYGRTESDIFIPFDGQQRLTTLFLFHKYVFEKCSSSSECLNKSNCICTDLLSRFSYYTRNSSKEFCDRLVKEKIILSKEQKQNYIKTYEEDIKKTNLSLEEKKKKINHFTKHVISNFIMDQKWFYIDWDKDSTILSMLLMLDEIDEQLDEVKDISYKSIAEKLSSGCNCPITFHFVDMGIHKLSDDTYIKMNARGKTLTAFENFKASLEQYLMDKIDNPNSNEQKDKYVILLERFKGVLNKERKMFTGIDGAWLEYFYQENDRILPDAMIHALFNRHFLNIWMLYYKKNNENKELEEFNSLIQTELKDTPDNKTFISWDDIYKPLFDLCGVDYCLTPIFNLCDYLISAPSIKLNINSSWNESDEDDDTSSFFKRKFTNNFRIVHYGILIFFASLDSPSNFNIQNFNDWLRVVWNIAIDPNIRSDAAVVSALEMIQKLSKWCQNIIPSLADNNGDFLQSLEDDNSFLNKQVIEEQYKAMLIQEKICTRDELISAEKIGFLKGHINFLFTDTFKQSPSSELFLKYKAVFEKIYNNCKEDKNHWIYIFISYIYDSNWLQKDKDITLLDHRNSWRALINDSFQNVIDKISDDVINPDIKNCPDIIQKLTELLPVYDKNRYGLLAREKNNQVILYCTSGKRSPYDNYVLSDDFHYNPFLAKLLDDVEELSSKQRAGKTNLFWGYNYIELNYKGKNIQIQKDYEIIYTNGESTKKERIDKSMSLEKVINIFNELIIA